VRASGTSRTQPCSHVWRRAIVAVLAGVALGAPVYVSAHDIPNDVTIQAFVKPEGQRLRVLVRAPLNAMRDVEYPMRGPDRLDVARADPVLRDAATIWIVGSLGLFEGDTPLSTPRIVAVRASLPGDRSLASY
jgi:hypothetical protein